eukprot:scaffold878_cov271-Pinguiococcus_pyrenoidosus.AAC.57
MGRSRFYNNSQQSLAAATQAPCRAERLPSRSIVLLAVVCRLTSAGCAWYSLEKQQKLFYKARDQSACADHVFLRGAARWGANDPPTISPSTS